jgi:hypothetical protein
LTRTPVPSTGKTRNLVPPPPPPRDPNWQKEKKKPYLTTEQKYAERKDCVVVKHIPACYNVVNHLTKYFQR